MRHISLILILKKCRPTCLTACKARTHKKFVKAMDHNGKGFQYLSEKFANEKSDAELKAGIFVGPDIKDVMKDENFDHHLNSLELGAWKSFQQVIHNFLGCAVAAPLWTPPKILSRAPILSF